MKKPNINSSVSKRGVKSKRDALTKLLDNTGLLDREDLGVHPQPIPKEKEGAGGKKLLSLIANKHAEMEKDCRTKMEAGARHLTSRTVKESIIGKIIAQKTTHLSRSKLDRLPIRELYQYLPRFDWRELAVVPPVRDQGECNSCWALTATEAFESSLMIKRANFATNDDDSRPDIFFIPQVSLNVHSTMDLDCVDPFGCDPGRVEKAFNYYFKEGIPAREIRLDNRPLDQASPTQPLPDPLARDTELPVGHCKEKTGNRIKIIGWNYVKPKPWRIPRVEVMQMALLEHGPLAVTINTQGLKEYGYQRLDDRSVEISSNLDTGVVFKKEKITGGLLVCFPAKLLRKKFVELLKIESFNLNDPEGGEQHYQFLTAAAAVFKQGTHRRRAKADLNVGKFYHRTTDSFFDANLGKSYQRETGTVIFHYPKSNAVRLEKGSKPGTLSLSFPANTETKFEQDDPSDDLTMRVPFRPPEDLDPVFEADPENPFSFNHYVLLVGWDDKKRAWIVQNSWGEEWGFNCHYQGGMELGNGYAYISYDSFGLFAAWLEADLPETGGLRGKNKKT